MTRDHYLALKGNLKSLAEQIRKTRQQLKADQREFSIFEREVGTYNALYNRDADLFRWGQAYKPLSGVQPKLLELKAEYRAKHIIYCLSRGRTLEQIEPKSREGYWRAHVYGRLIPRFAKVYEFEGELPDIRTKDERIYA